MTHNRRHSPPRDRPLDVEYDPAIVVTRLYNRVVECNDRLITILKDCNEGKIVSRQVRCCLSEDVWCSMRQKLITLLPLTFEALIIGNAEVSTPQTRLCALQDLIDTARESHAPAKTYALFADMILSCARDKHNRERLSNGDATNLLRKVICAVRTLPAYNVDQASRWIRCVLLLSLDNTPLNDRNHDGTKLRIVEEVVDQAIMLAQQALSANGDVPMNDEDEHATQQNRMPYPSEELEWISTTLFNRAVDYYVVEQEELAKKWATKAVEVADVLALQRLGDGGSLTRTLREKMETLGY